MMNYICHIINRKCVFKTMSFDELIPSVVNKTVDIATSGITITLDRLKVVSMSNPYMLSSSMFLTTLVNKKEPFELGYLVNKKLGVQKGTIFGSQAKELNIQGVKIIEYKSEREQIDALSKKNIDYALMDTATALYWQNQSQRSLVVAGSSLEYGIGYGIVINSNDDMLLNDINYAIAKYVRSNEYLKNYEIYFSNFN